MPMKGIERCVWLSISPGRTKQPLASITDVPSGAATLPTAAIVSPSMRTSAANSPSAVTTVPLAMSVVSVMAWLLSSSAEPPTIIHRHPLVHARGRGNVPGAVLNVMTWNVRHSTPAREVVDTVVELIERHLLDIVMLQEVTPLSIVPPRLLVPRALARATGWRLIFGCH